MTKLEKWVLNEMMNKLEDWEDMKVCLSELSWKLFELENYNESYWCSSCRAREWVKEYFDDLGDVVEEMTSEWGIEPANVFSHTESFQVQVVLYLAERLLCESQYMQDKWDDADEVILTEEIIKQIKDSLGCLVDA